MSKIAIICPTFDHQDSLYATLKSVQQQTLGDFEVHVIGDGSPPRTTEIMKEICSADPRFHFQAYPKHHRYAEFRRDELIRKLEHIEYFAYIADDDLWLPWHLQLLIQGLQNSGFAHTMHHQLQRNGHIQALMFHNRSGEQNRALQQRKFPCFGLSNAAHTRSAYFQLNEGWSTTPLSVMTDLNMWAKFAENNQISQAEYLFPSVLHLHSRQRHDLSPAERNSEAMEILEAWQDGCPLRAIYSRTSFLHSFDFMVLATTPPHIGTLEEVLAYHQFSVQSLTEGEALPDPLDIEKNTLYLYPAQEEALIVLLAQKRHGVSRQSYKAWKALYRIYPDDNDILYQLADAEFSLGEPQATLRLLKEKIEIENCQSNFLLLMAHAAIQCRQLDYAQELLENGLERFPGNYWISLRLLEFYLHCGLLNQARTLSQAALEKYPDDQIFKHMHTAANPTG